MAKSYGSDENGDFVLWEDSKGQINKKYIDGPAKGEHQGYDPNTRRSFVAAQHRSKDKKNDDGDNSTSSGGSTCFIATACLSTKGISASVLDPLKDWRYSVMESTLYGRLLSNLYRKEAPVIATAIGDFPRVCSLLDRVFVQPSLKLVRKKHTTLCNFLLYILFLTGFMLSWLLITVLKLFSIDKD